jgi:hypothetical protein
MVIKKFEAAPSSQRLPGCWRQPVTLARSLAAGGLHESRRARCSRSSRRPCFVRGFSRTARNTEQAVFRSWLLTNGPKHGAGRVSFVASHERPETRSRPCFVRGFSRTARNTEQTVFRSWLLTNGPKHGARRIDETAEAIFHRVEIQQLPSPISTSPAETGFVQAGAASPRAPRTPRAPRFTDQCARANGAMFPENIHQTLTRAVIRIVTRHLGLYRP